MRETSLSKTSSPTTNWSSRCPPTDISSRLQASTYRTQGRGGRGVKAASLHEDDVVNKLVHTTAHAYLLFFTNQGKVHRIKAHEIPRKDRTAKGVLAQSVLPLEPEERIEAVIDTRNYETSRYLVMVTKQGLVKKTPVQRLRLSERHSGRHQSGRRRRVGGGAHHQRRERHAGVHRKWVKGSVSRRRTFARWAVPPVAFEASSSVRAIG